MSETLPNDPFSTHPPGQEITPGSHQTIYSPQPEIGHFQQTAINTPNLGETRHSPDQPPPATAETIPASETEHTGTPAEAPANNETPETDPETEELIREFENLESLFRAASGADKVLGDQIRVSLSKINDSLQKSNPNEAGREPIKRSITNLTQSLSGNTFYRSIVEGDRDLIPLPSFKEALKEVLSKFRRSSDPTERQQTSQEAQRIIETQLTQAQELASKIQQQTPERNRLKSSIDQALKEATEKEKQIIQIVNDGQPLPPESISAIYSRLATELASYLRNYSATEQNIAELVSKSQALAERLKTLIASKTITEPGSLNSVPEPAPAEPTTTPETASAQPPVSSVETIQSEEGINSVQKEIIDRAMSDPDSRDRLATIIRTFGTPAVKAYLESKLA